MTHHKCEVCGVIGSDRALMLHKAKHMQEDINHIMPNRSHNHLMHEAGRHEKRLAAAQCRYCDDAEAADRLRALYDAKHGSS